MTIQRKSVIVDGKTLERTWEVDSRVLRTIRGNDWLQDFPQLLQQDLNEMQQAFPHWFLASGNGMTPAACNIDQEFIVPINGQMRCVKCGQSYDQSLTSLLWIGQLTVQITGAGKVERKLRELIASRRMSVSYLDKGTAFFVYPAVKVKYPSNWPRSAPEAHYFAGFLESLGIIVGSGTGRTNHDLHMNSQIKMCLFSDWHQMSIREVVQNRIVPHAHAQVIIANGERPQRWFN